MKRQRPSTRFYAMELPGSTGHQKETDLSTEEDTPYESDSESEQPLIASRRKSAKKRKDTSSDSDTDSEAPLPSSHSKAPQPLAASSLVPPTSTANPLSTSIITFHEMVDYAKSKCLSWKTDVDYSIDTLFLFRLEVDSGVLTVERSVQFRSVPRESRTAGSFAKKIVADVCVGRKLLGKEFFTSIINRAEICTEEDIGRLLKQVEQLPRSDPLQSSQMQSTVPTVAKNCSSVATKPFSVQPAFSVLSFPAKSRFESPSRMSRSTSQFLQSLGSDLRAEQFRSKLLHGTNERQDCIRSNSGKTATNILHLLRERPAMKFNSPHSDDALSPGEAMADDENPVVNGHDIPSLSSSVTDPSLPQKSEAEPEQFFWREPGENRAKLFPHDLYVSAWDLCYMRRNYGLLTDLPRTMGHAILFGWDLICHMLGGPVVVCRRLKNARSDQEKTAGVLLGADVYQMVLEYIEHSLFSKKLRTRDTFSPKIFTEAMDKKIFELPSTQNKCEEVKKTAQAVQIRVKRPLTDSESEDEDKLAAKRRKLADGGHMYDIHCKYTCKALGRVQLTAQHPDFYIDNEKLEELQRLHGLGMNTRQGQKGVAWYGYKVMEYWLGGEELIRQFRMTNEKRAVGIIRMAGKKMAQVVLAKDVSDSKGNVSWLGKKKKCWKTEADHCHEKYPTDPQIERIEFMNTCSTHSKHTRVRDEQATNRNTLASVLFVEDLTDQLAPATDAPCRPNVKYWSVEHPSRMRLHEHYGGIFVDKVGMAEYQRYYGPESALGEVAFTDYSVLIFVYLVGGEELVLTQLRQQTTGAAMKWIRTHEAEFLDAYLDHVAQLFAAANLTEEKVLEALRRGIDSRMKLMHKNKGRLPKGVPYFDGTIPRQVILLDEQEYWRTPAADRTQLRKGHDVYINTTFLTNTQVSFGPLSKEPLAKKYAFAIAEHMLGGEDVMNRARNDKVFWQGVRSMFRIADLIALCLHTDGAFHLTECLHPRKLLNYARDRVIDRRRDRTERKQRQVKKYSNRN